MNNDNSKFWLAQNHLTVKANLVNAVSMQAGNEEQLFNGIREDQDFWIRCKLLAK